MIYRKLLLAALFSLAVHTCFADKYPRNYSIDIIHYAFELTLSDNTDEIIGQTTIDVEFRTNDVKQLRFDLVNKTDQRTGKGMVVESVTFNNTELEFTHKDDVLFIKLGQP